MSVNILTDFQGNQLPLANDNLLINSDFRNPINQRGQTSYTADATYNKVYSVDRWAVTYRGKVTVNDGYITVENTNTNPGAAQVEAFFVQQFENNLNDDLVLQVKVKSITGDVKVFGYALEVGLNVFTSDSSTSRGNITFVIGYGASVELEYIKLEQGTIATPLIPILVAKEFPLCQRYEQISNYVHGMGIAYYGNVLLYLPLSCPLRTTPKISFSGTVSAIRDGIDSQNITSMSYVGHSDSLVIISCATSGSVENGTVWRIEGGKIELDAEIK